MAIEDVRVVARPVRRSLARRDVGRAAVRRRAPARVELLPGPVAEEEVEPAVGRDLVGPGGREARGRAAGVVGARVVEAAHGEAAVAAGAERIPAEASKISL